MSKIGDMKARLGCVLTRYEQPNPATSLDEDEVADMLMLLVEELEEHDRRLKKIEGALKSKGAL